MNKEVYEPRLRKLYREEIVSKLKETFGYKNTFRVPKLEKIVVNSGVGEAKEDEKALDKVKKDLSVITGQLPRITRARKAIANFKIRGGMPIGVSVTLRKKRMYEFLDRFINIASPRIKDFRGFNPRSFDGNGNYTLGLNDQTIFVEIDAGSIDKTFGMDITFVTNAVNDSEAKELLKLLGFPFKR